jgi:hypothetical protein
MKILTTKGLIEMDELTVRDVVELGDNYRKIATEYRLNGELVRRDVAASMLRGPDMASEQGQIN